jgi:hypothetical protein
MSLFSINRPRETLRPSSHWSAIPIYLPLLYLSTCIGSRLFHRVLQVSDIILCTVKVPNQNTSQAKYLKNKMLNKTDNNNNNNNNNNRFPRD